MVVFDASVLIDLFHPRTHPDRKAKLDHLVADLQRKKIKIVIPTPALSEFLARAGKARDAYHTRLSTSAAFRIAAFDSRAALECALLLDAALTGGDKRAQARTWAKAKFDWQIVAIAKVAKGSALVSPKPTSPVQSTKSTRKPLFSKTSRSSSSFFSGWLSRQA